MTLLEATSGRDRPATSAGLKPIGRVTAVTGSKVTIELSTTAASESGATVGKFMAVATASGLIVGLTTEISEQMLHSGDRAQSFRNSAEIDLIGEIRNQPASPQFGRGVSQYPNIGDPAVMLTEAELRLIYGSANADRVAIGHLQQNLNVRVHVDIEPLINRHFAIVGTTGVGKSSGVATILRKIMDVRSNLRIFLVDPHNEYSHCFGDKAQVLTPGNLRLPFWLFNFEEIVDAFFGGRPGVDEELEILSEAIPLAKVAYLQYRSNADRLLAKKRDQRDPGFTADTPVPYRIEDLIGSLDEQMGRLENRSSRMIYHKLISRIQTVRNHPRYAFMFENANIGGDTMAEILCQLFRLPPQGKPMTIMQLAGFPAEVVDSVVSVLCRMAFDFGLWSDGIAPLLFVCEEAHRYAPADKKIGFGPTRRALSRIAKEGRKYGVFLGLVTQRPAEIDPTIVSQCSTLFVMRLSNDRDQDLIRSAASEAARNLLSFIPSLGTREAFAFGPGVSLPTRMSFDELAAAYRPNSEATGDTRSDASANISQDLIAMVIDRWRAASANHRAREFDSADRTQPVGAPFASMPQPQPSASRTETLRDSILKKPLDQIASDRAATVPPRLR
jgi:uncharacterized protein